MEIIDISWPITPSMTAYKDKKIVAFEHAKNFAQDNVCESYITLGSHTGTHVDAPAHFMQQGSTIDQLPLQALIGPCRVLDMTHIDEYIGRDDLTNQSLQEGEIILFKTTNSALSANQPFNKNFVYVAASAAEVLVEKKVKAVGIDYLGIERNQPDHATHTTLFKNNIVIIEGLRLQRVQPGHYTLYCLPLAVVGLEAAPARAVLIKK
jgi:arylformamidase